LLEELKDLTELVFQFISAFHINRVVTSVKVNNNGNGNSSFRSGDRNYEDRKKQAVQFIREEVFVEGNKIDIYTIQNQFQRHQHRDHVPTGKKAVHANKE
jgi:hypothetical protein